LSLFRGLGKWRLPLKRGGVLTQTAKELILLLAAMLVLVVAGMAYAANTYPAHYAAIKGGTIRVRMIPSLRRGPMGW
jgi:hypothetical protein